MNVNIFQDTPEVGHQLSRSWATLNGHVREAKELLTCLTLNSRTPPYHLEAVVKFTTPFATDPHQQHQQLNDHNDAWKKATGNMKKSGVVAFWSREPSRTNRIHYHLVISHPHDRDEAEAALKASVPPGHDVHVHVDPIDNLTGLLAYTVKAKVGGYHPKTGVWTPDKWATKRLLFAPHVKLRKVGKVGPFWTTPKAKLWKGVIEKERGIALHLQAVLEEAAVLHDAFPMVSLKKITRTRAFFAWKNPGRKRGEKFTGACT